MATDECHHRHEHRWNYGRMGAAVGAVGSASAIQAAFQKASASMSSSGAMPSMGSVGGSGGDGSSDGGSSGGESSINDSLPFSQAAGFGDSSSSSSGGFARAVKLVTSTASEVAKGVGSQMRQGVQERVSETAGGKLATSIRESMEPKGASQSGQFDRNSLGGTPGNDDVASLVNRDTYNNEGKS